MGVPGRLSLLQRLGASVAAAERFFPTPHGAPRGAARPGHLVDYLWSIAGPGGAVSVHALWEAVMGGFGGVWPPTRTAVDGVPMGDVWAYRRAHARAPVMFGAAAFVACVRVVCVRAHTREVLCLP